MYRRDQEHGQDNQETWQEVGRGAALGSAPDSVYPRAGAQLVKQTTFQNLWPR